MRRATATLAILAVFVAGIAAGVFGTHLFYLRHFREPGGLVGWGARLLASDLKSDLDLTSAQAAQIDVILSETRQEALVVRRKITPEMMSVVLRSRHRIEAILTPEQRVKFDKLRERRMGRFRHWMAGR